MEIEQKERERIEADVDAYIKKLWHDVNSPNTKSPKIVEAIAHFRAGKQSEHLHLQKEVIQPLAESAAGYKRLYIATLEGLMSAREEIKALMEALENLASVQNGPPLVTYTDDWNRAMEKVNELLKNEG